MGAAMAILVFTLVARPGRRAAARRTWKCLLTPVGVAAAVMFACWLASVAGSHDLARSIEKWGRTLLFIVAAAFLWARLSEDGAALRLALKALLIGSLATGLLVLDTLYYGTELVAFLLGTPGSTYANLFKSLASAVACLIPAVVGAGFALGGRWRWAALACLPFLLIIIYESHSRAATLGLGAACIILLAWGLIRVLPRKAAWATTVILSLLLAAAAWALISRLPAPPLTAETSFEIPSALIDEHRQIIWGFTFAKGAEAPLLGHGPDVVNRLPGADYTIPGFLQSYLPAHPHNWILEIFAETGTIGLVAMLVTLFLFLRHLFRRPPDVPLGALVALNGVYWASGLANFSFWAAWWQGTYLVLSAILLAAAGGRARRAST